MPQSTPQGYGLGWRRQLPDQRDRFYAAPSPTLQSLPKLVDLRHSGFEPPIYNQEQTSSCTGNGVAALMHFDLIKQGQGSLNQVPSRLFAYYNGRAIEGTTEMDGGAVIRDVIKGVARWGICFEDGQNSWPFNPRLVTVQPSANCYAAALHDRAIEYQAIPQQINQLRACLADGYMFTFGFQVYESLESPEVSRTGRLLMPQADEAPIGGHCVTAVGYNDADEIGGRVFLCRNSWGGAWGLRGHFLMPYEYILDPQLSSDFWMIRTVGQ